MKFTTVVIFLFILLFSDNSKANDNAVLSARGYDYINRSFVISYQNPDSAIIYSYWALQIGQQIKDSFLEASAYNELGNAYRIVGQTEKSITCFFKSLSLLADSEKELSKKAAVYGSLGNSYYQLGDIEQAIIYYRRGFDLKKELGRERESAIVACLLVGIYGITDNADSSFFYASFAEPILLKTKDTLYLASLYNSMGIAHQMIRGDFDSALVYFQKSYQYYSQIGLTTQLPNLLFNIAGIEVEKSNFKAALFHYNEGLKLIEKQPNIEMEKLFYQSIAEAYQRKGDLIKTVEFFHKKDSLEIIIQANKEQLAFDEMSEKFKVIEQDNIIKTQEFDLQKEKLNAAQQEQRFYKFMVLVVIVFTALVLIAIWFWFKRKTQQNIEKEKERFFSNVMHEIRTPLSLITGPIENLKGELSNHDKEKNLALINRNSNRLITLVNQLLDVSKVDAKKYQLTNKSANVSHFIEELILNYEPMLSAKKINLKTSQLETSLTLLIDFDVLEKIFSNLISNAIKYSKQDGAIEINSKISANKLVFGIRDYGIGISKTDQNQIFSRFSRGQNSGTNNGIGIGLSLVKYLTELLNGTIYFESKLNEGSYFEVTIPVNLSAVKNENKEFAETSETILLVEDDEDMRQFIHDTLKQDNYNVLLATNGKKAIEILNEHLPDLILSDVMMPEMDGIELSKLVKNNPLFQHIPMLLLSAKKASETKIASLNQGADLYLEKPFHPKELLLTVKNYLITLARNREKFDAQLKKEQTFEEKIHSDDLYIQKLNVEILKELDNADFSVEELADRLAISRSQLHRKLKTLTGKSISNYVRIIRLEKSLELLKKKAGNVTEIAYSTGFNSQSYFTKCFIEHFGYPPSDAK